MNERIKNLKGSSKRDIFKWAHKNKMNDAPFYAADADLCLIMSKPKRGVVAYLDYKGSGEPITFTEQILYDEWVTAKPVYIVEGADPENGPFKIHLYKFGGECEHVRTVSDWSEFTRWESEVRTSYSRRST